ncbi:MAG: DPP IV N-terminal domain-containing protein [Deltaproteobacteria bacterium]|nr:DPP IV N-terminal domain-containing protein [Deltaproteobacteria bacterium]MBN2672188.1 DPP IV N-terminal domain-containing protein [Deltaproteobacteria bacterium]
MKTALIWTIVLLAAACSKAPPCPTVAPFQSLLNGNRVHNGVDPDIARIFSGHATEKPPAGFKWAPDSRTIAYLETSPGNDDDTRLWVIDAVKRRKRPLFIGESETVAHFVWLDAGTLLVQTKDKVFTLTLDGEIREVLSPATDIEALQASPDGRYLSYRKQANLFVYKIEDEAEMQLTHIEESFMCAGCVSWLYEEEFETEQGYGWSKDSTRLWFREVDERHVQKRTVDLETIGETKHIPYSKAGESNPLVKIGVVDVTDGSHTIHYADAVADDDAYLPDAMWHPVRNTLIITRLDRLQTRFDLLQCDEALVCTPVFSHTDPRWVNYPGLPRFSLDGSGYALNMELGEYAHIHWFDSGTHEHRPLTKGSFQVRQIEAVTNDAVYFAANPNDPLSLGLYKVSISDGTMTAVNKTPGHHEAVYAPDASLHLDTYSNIDASPSVHLYDNSGHSLLRIDETEGRDYRPPKEIVNEFSTIESEHGDTLYIQVTRPDTTVKNKTYPVLVYVYGGPRYQAVMNRYNTTFTAWRNLMAQRGFVVFSLDNRGSAGRGRTFETAAHRNLTATALEDQLTGIKWLKRQSYVAKDRIGILGWSFGGTMTLTALLHTENLFRLGVAIAPVTDWRRYDTAYTERYMQRPIDNSENYLATDLTRRARELTEHLMIVHGTGDDNVLPENSMAMIDAIAREGRQVDIRLYPGQPHSISDRASRVHLFSEITRFIEQYL